ncbi:MAG: c-type cytochrome, partial [Vicinamibacterales bacterium]|nr:c-type cytochrome [Vicinamibacterales bacterium]
LSAFAAVVGQAQPGAAPTGQQLYTARCATCHGTTGKGDGAAASKLAVRPRDLTAAVYKFRSTLTGSLPTDQDLLRVVTDGVPGTSMIAWKDLMTETDRQAVVSYIKGMSPRFTAESPVPVDLGAPVPSSPASIEAGRQLYASLQCSTCHGEAGQAATAAIPDFQDDWGQRLVPTHLTEPWTFKGGSSPREIAMRLKTGIDGTPMPALADVVPDNDIWHLVNYMASLARQPVWAMTADEVRAHYAAEDTERARNPVERGRHLADVCAHCHSPHDASGRILPDLKFAGGLRMKLSVWDTVVTTNLTSDRETGIGGYTDDELLKSITHGIRRDGSRMLPFPMGWTAWAHLTSEDQRAIVAYLRTIPPVTNRIPPRAAPGVFAYLSDKFRMLILGADDPTLFYSGNAGTRETADGSPKQEAR